MYIVNSYLVLFRLFFCALSHYLWKTATYNAIMSEEKACFVKARVFFTMMSLWRHYFFVDVTKSTLSKRYYKHCMNTNVWPRWLKVTCKYIKFAKWSHIIHIYFKKAKDIVCTSPKSYTLGAIDTQSQSASLSMAPKNYTQTHERN